MQLLVSVRLAAEVGPALAGGADIIDAKEPTRGPLGAVDRATLAAILARVPEERVCSVALGDVAREEQLLSTMSDLPIFKRAAALYLKVGFAGVPSGPLVSRLLRSSIAAAADHPAAPRVVAVTYADRAGSLRPDDLAQRAAGAGAAGVLLDTHLKDGRGLFGWMAPREVEAWISGVHAAGLFAAVAGEIGSTDLEMAHSLGADIVGVRGAACEGGREGTVTAERVMSLRLRIASTGFGLSSPAGRIHGSS